MERVGRWAAAVEQQQALGMSGSGRNRLVEGSERDVR